MQPGLAIESGRRLVPGGVSNRQRLARYDVLIERAQQRSDEATALVQRRRYLKLMLRLQKRALRELDRGR